MQKYKRYKHMQTTTSSIGVGFLGFGFIGKLHAHAHRSLPLFFDNAPETRLIGVCTWHEASAEKAKKQGGFEFATTNVEEILAHPEIDLVHICTPNDSHFEQIKRALAAGKHVYCDKPLALNSVEAKELVLLASASEKVCRMTFNYRFFTRNTSGKRADRVGLSRRGLSLSRSLSSCGLY